MTLTELSTAYLESAEALRRRIRDLEREKRRCRENREAVLILNRRIADLDPLLREARDLAVLTARYYDRGYHKNEKYTV